MSIKPVADGSTNGLLGQLVGGLDLKLSDRMKRLIAAYVLTRTSLEVVRRTHHGVRSRFVYTIAVPSGDEIYSILHERILALIPAERRRSIIVRAMRGTHASDSSMFLGDVAASPDRGEQRMRPGVFYDSTREQAIQIGGRRVLVTVEKEEDGYRDGERYQPKTERIVFTAYGAQARDAVMAFIAELTDGLNEPEAPRFYMPRWGSWNRRDDLVPRHLDTVILRDGQKEELVADLRRFLTGRDAYERLGIPWHRGYLFHGPPGTGKTSLARALATELGMDIYFLPISDLELDASLLQLVSSVPAQSMLLLEDIDILHGAKQRDDEVRGVTMSGILNALDGVSTPAGLITVMTTNHREVLDDAMLRPGRVDREEQIGFLDDAQLGELVTGFFGEPLTLAPVGSREIAPADVAETLKRHMGDPDAQLLAIKELLS